MASRVLAILLLLCALGCQSAAKHPTAPPTASAADPAPGPTAYTGLGQYAIAVDLHTLTGTVEFQEPRAGTQSELYNLGVTQFLSWESFHINRIALNADSLEIDYALAHPFKAPANLAGPATAANRADLAASGRVLWIEDDPDPDTYFAGEGDVRVNTRIVRNPDGYFTPGALIAAPGTTANTFPFQLIVDERRDNRVGLSNGGFSSGNYSGFNGWQTAEFTDGITGYDIWAQGQTATNTLIVSRGELGGAAEFSTIAAVVVKYEDPRGGANISEKRANRLPLTDTPTAFGYRMPHGALDVGRLTVYASSILEDGALGAIAVAAHVRDWDARAIEAAQTNLAAETDPTLVSAGESGLPTLTIDIPAITGLSGNALALTDDDAAYGGDSGEDNGDAMDELFYLGNFTGTPSGAGTITGLVRARDIVDITPPADWPANRIDLDPNLDPLGTGSEGATYGAFHLEVFTDAPAPFIDAATWGGLGVQIARSVDIDAAGNIYVVGTFQNTTDFDPGPGTEDRDTVGVDAFVLCLDPSHNFLWVSAIVGSLTDEANSIVVDDAGNSYIAGEFYDITDFDPGAGTAERTSAGDRDGYLLALDPTGAFRWVATWGDTGAELGRAVGQDAFGNLYVSGEFRGTVDFDPSGGTASRTADGPDSYTVSFDSNGNYRWVAVIGGIYFDKAEGIGVDETGDNVTTGAYESEADLDPGPGEDIRIAEGGWDSYALKLDRDGNREWAATWGAGPTDYGNAATFDPFGNVLIAGNFGGLADFDPDNGVVHRTGLGFYDGYILSLAHDGDFRWVYTVLGAGHEDALGLDTDAAGNVYVAGYFNDTVDFDAGPGVNVRSTPDAYHDVYILSISPFGVHRWVATLGGISEDYAYGIHADKFGNTTTVGSYWDTVDFDPGAGTDEHTSAGGPDAFVVKLGP